MTGLFDSITQRFSVGSAPAITPRARVRFAQSSDEDGLTEEVTEQRAPVPQAPHAPTPPAVDTATHGPTPVAANAPPVVAPRSTPTTLDPAPSERITQPTAQVNIETPDHSDPASARPHPAVREVSVPNSPEAPPGQATPDAPRTNQPEPTATLRTNERLTTHETTVVTRIAPAEQPAASADNTPSRRPDPDTPTAATAPPNVTVKIGRIEVSKPAPATPPRASAPPQAPRNGSRSNASTLTRYLGWKS